MAEKAISKLLRYIEPILTFADNHIDLNGLIRPIGVVDQNYTTAEGKNLKVPRTYEEWVDFRSEKDTEIFNPFVVTKHMVFLAELVRRKLNEIYAPIADDEAFFEDEEIEDDNEFVKIIKTDAPGIKIITFSMVRGGTEEPVAEGAHSDDNLALWLACANAAKTHMRKPPEDLQDTDKILEGIERLSERFQKERKSHMKEEFELDGLNAEELDGFEEDYEPMDNITDSYFIEPTTIEGDPIIIDSWDVEEEYYSLPKFLPPKEIGAVPQLDAYDMLAISGAVPSQSYFDDFDLDVH